MRHERSIAANDAAALYALWHDIQRDEDDVAALLGVL